MALAGKFITLEGGEGAGKSTQIRALTERLEACGLSVVTTREPGGSPGSEQIRELLVTGASDRWMPASEALLNYAARAEHLRTTIVPALENNQWVLCDRFADSTMAYQGIAMGLGADFIEMLYQQIVGTHGPDMTVILDLPPAEGLARAAARQEGEDRYEKMDTAFHQTLRQAFLTIARTNPQRCVVIDASVSPAEVTENIWQSVRNKFPDPLSKFAGQ